MIRRALTIIRASCVWACSWMVRTGTTSASTTPTGTNTPRSTGPRTSRSPSSPSGATPKACSSSGPVNDGSARMATAKAILNQLTQHNAHANAFTLRHEAAVKLYIAALATGNQAEIEDRRADCHTTLDIILDNCQSTHVLLRQYTDALNREN